MKENLQQKLMTEYLWEVINADDNNPFNNIDSLDEYIKTKVRRISSGDMIAIDLQDSFNPIKLVDGFYDLSTIGRDAVLISYKEMESKFYEQVQREFYG
tara:strand:- start:487 stop:783 length:297 start_codon:yes stop_codon:yes gene_type:complete